MMVLCCCLCRKAAVRVVWLNELFQMYHKKLKENRYFLLSDGDATIDIKAEMKKARKPLPFVVCNVFHGSAVIITYKYT